MLKQIDSSIAIGNDREENDLKNLWVQGYKTVIDLSTPPEGKQIDQGIVQGLGFTYMNFPVSPRNLDAQIFTDFKSLCQSSPAPVYIYCPNGLRSGVFGLMLLADAKGFTEEQYLEEFATLGIDQKPDCPLRSFSHQWFSYKTAQ